MKGSIVERGDRLHVVVRPRHPATGRTRPVWRAVPRPEGLGKRAYRQAAEKLLRQLLDEYDERGYVRRDARTTLAQHLDSWLRAKEHQGLAGETLRSYRHHVERRIKPALGGMPLFAIRPADVRDYLLGDYATRRLVRQAKDEDPVPTGEPVAPRTPALLHAILYGALEDAVRLELIARNPVRQIPPPRAERRREPHPLTELEAAQLVTAAEQIGSRYAALYRLAIATGLRAQNLLDLTWADVDLSQARVVNRHAKTKASEQALPIGKDTVAALRLHRRHLAEEKLRAGPAWPKDEPAWVFPNTVGRHTTYGQIRGRDLPRVAAAAGLDGVRMHDLRRTCGTLMLERGVPAQVAAARLGHRSAAFFQETYAFALPSTHERAADVMDDVLAGRRPGDKAAERSGKVE